jgi:LmbE family N-acetylglucosaminyl deacetylase
MRIPRVARRLVRRTSAVVPAPVVRAVARAIGPANRPVVGLPDARRIVVLAPHPDDESLGCGGLLLLASRRGADISVVFATDGDDMLIADSPGDLGPRRREQATEACRILGARPIFLGFEDGRLADAVGDLAAALRRILAEIRPDLVVLPWFGDASGDHRALNDAFATTPLDPDLRVWGCEIWSPLPANRLVDITGVVDDKVRAIAAHTADVLLNPDAILGLHRFRAGVARINGTYAEAYFEAPAATYVGWIRSSSA